MFVPCHFWRVQFLPIFSIVALFERPSLRISLQSSGSSVPLSPSRRGFRQSGTPHSSESLSTSDAAVNVPVSPSSSAVKEEPCDIDKVFIQWEISQQESERHQEDGDTRGNKTPTDNRNVSHIFCFYYKENTPRMLSQFNSVFISIQQCGCDAFL